MILLRPFKFNPVALEKAQNDQNGKVARLTGDEMVLNGDDKDLTLSKMLEKYGEDLVGIDAYAKMQEGKLDLTGSATYKEEHITVDDTYDMPMPRPHNFRLLVVESGHLVMTDNTGRETTIVPGDHIFIPAVTSIVVLDGYATVRLATL